MHVDDRLEQEEEAGATTVGGGGGGGTPKDEEEEVVKALRESCFMMITGVYIGGGGEEQAIFTIGVLGLLLSLPLSCLCFLCANQHFFVNLRLRGLFMTFLLVFVQRISRRRPLVGTTTWQAALTQAWVSRVQGQPPTPKRQKRQGAGNR